MRLSFLADALLRGTALLLLLGTLGALTPGAHAQTATLRGFVTDAADGQPLPSVNVVLERDGALEAGATTDLDGFYTLSRVAPGRYVLRASFVGYETFTDTLTLAGGELRSLTVALAPTAEALGEVTVESERTTGAANVTAGLQSIEPKDIELVPAPDVSGDLATYLTTLPGVVATGDQGGQLFIRGGEPTQNLVLLDGIPLYQPFHVLGFYSAFPTDILSRADVYAGGYPAGFGGRLSSVMDVKARTGDKRRFGGFASVAPFVSAAQVEGPLWPGRVSFLASGRISVVEQGAERLVDEELPFEFGDVFAKVHATPNEASQFAVTGFHTFDEGAVGDLASPRPDVVRWENTGIGGRYLFFPSASPVLGEIGLSGTRFATELGPDDGDANPAAPTRSSSLQRFQGDVDLTYFYGATVIDAGAFIHTTQIESELGGLFQDVDTEKEFVTEAGLYVEPDLPVWGGLRVTPGVRVTTASSLNQVFVEPRLRAVWEGGIHRLSAAAGLYHQSFVGVSDRRDATSIFTAWTPAPSGALPRAAHVILGYRIAPTPWAEVAVEGFYKRLDDLSVAELTPFPRLTTRLQTADGEARGVDVRLELRGRGWYGHVNYGLSEVTYEIGAERFELWYGTDRLRYRPAHDRRHQVNALFSATLYGFEFNARWQFGSGLPFSQPLGFDRFVLMDGDADLLEEAGDRRVIYDRPFDALLPTYHRLDLSVERAFELGLARLVAQAGVINVYDRANVFSFDLFTLRRVDQLPLIPSFGLRVEIP